jgi:sigma-E factor negative regulatory protein RseA
MKLKPHSQPANAGEPLDDPHAGEPRAWLSALADGEAQAVPRACALWRGDADARRTWHAYHLIGDVLRSDELATAPARDAAFLDKLRERLAQEPVIVAPGDAGVVVRAAGQAQPRRGQRWLVPVAAAAGFVVVAGVLVVVRMSGADGAPAWASLAAASRPGVTRVSTEAGTVAPAAAGGTLIRDARLDEFLRAHQAARGGVAVAAPGGTLRRVEAAAPADAPR